MALPSTTNKYTAILEKRILHYAQRPEKRMHTYRWADRKEREMKKVQLNYLGPGMIVEGEEAGVLPEAVICHCNWQGLNKHKICIYYNHAL